MSIKLQNVFMHDLKFSLRSDYYKEMRLDTKVAYSVLKDRLALSLKNNWIDEAGYIYLMYSNSKLMEILSCSKSTLLRIKKQLNEYGLIREVQQSTSKSGKVAYQILEELNISSSVNPKEIEKQVVEVSIEWKALKEKFDSIIKDFTQYEKLDRHAEARRTNQRLYGKIETKEDLTK